MGNTAFPLGDSHHICCKCPYFHSWSSRLLPRGWHFEKVSIATLGDGVLDRGHVPKIPRHSETNTMDADGNLCVLILGLQRSRKVRKESIYSSSLSSPVQSQDSCHCSKSGNESPMHTSIYMHSEQVVELPCCKSPCLDIPKSLLPCSSPRLLGLARFNHALDSVKNGAVEMICSMKLLSNGHIVIHALSVMHT